MWENPDLPWVVITMREIRFLLAKSTIFLAGFSAVQIRFAEITKAAFFLGINRGKGNNVKKDDFRSDKLGQLFGRLQGIGTKFGPVERHEDLLIHERPPSCPPHSLQLEGMGSRSEFGMLQGATTLLL
jgi:hypothetical protein